MFKYEAQGDFNVSRQFTNGVINVYDADMNLTATFSGDNAEESYGYFTHGIATHGSYTVFDLDKGVFNVGDLGQLDITQEDEIDLPASELHDYNVERFTGDTLDSVRTAD